MPGDRSNLSGPGRPVMPTLATNRTAKPPFTPKLATKANTISTPGARTPVSSQTGGLTRGGAREEQSTPTNALLNNNVTPRSSSRKSRVDSSQTTPTSAAGDMPNGVWAQSPSHGRVESLTGLGITDSPKLTATRPRSQVSGLRSSPLSSAIKAQNICESLRPASEIMDRNDSPNFFHASDARPQNSAPRQPEPKKAPAFFYADGREEDLTGKLSVQSSEVSADGKPKISSKFFYADGSADQTQAFPLLSPPISTTSSRSSFISSPTQAVPPLLPTSQIQHHQVRPASPPKENIHLSYRKGASQVIPANANRQPVTSISATSTPILTNQSQFDIGHTAQRRSSAASSTIAKSRSHTKTASMSSIDVTPRKSKCLQNSSPITPLTANSSSPISSTEPMSAVSKQRLSMSPTLSTWPRSPTKPVSGGSRDSNDSNGTSNSGLQNLNELAAKARQDRKVLDLEISNSSLLAINRSLEREIRKQKTELRRFRRFTRKSSIRKFSMASSARSTSFGIAGDDGDVDGLGEGVDDLRLDDFEDEDEDDYSEYSDEDDAEERKEKDAKRLRLDLSKHREILVDSQKLNQSIKRCVGFTEELISQGKRALEYKVRVSDIKLGGRILSEDEAGSDVDGLHDALEDGVGSGDLDPERGNGASNLDDECQDTNGSLANSPRESNTRMVSFESALSNESNGTEAGTNGAIA